MNNSTRKPISLIMNSSDIATYVPSRPRAGADYSRATHSTRGLNTRNQQISARLPHSETSQGKILCSIFESKGLAPKVGLCFIDTMTSAMIITELVDSQTYVRTIHKLTVYSQQQMQIIIPNYYTQPSKTNLVKIIESNLEEDVKITSVAKRYFNPVGNSKWLIADYVEDSDKAKISMELNSKFYALSAANAAISFMKDSNDYSFVHDQFNVKYQSSESSLFIDTNSIKSLELVENLVDPVKGISLFKFLNSTSTKMGERLLKNNILQPLTNRESLVARYEATQEMINDSGALLEVKCLLKELTDLDKLFSLLIKKHKLSVDTVSNQRINTVILLKQTMNICKQLKERLKDFNSPLMIQVKNILGQESVNETLELINENISEDCFWASKPLDLKNQQCYAVKSGMNGLLDVSRQLYKNIIDEILASVETISQENHILLGSKYDSTRGFYIQIRDPSVKINELPEVFINRKKRSKFLECTTLEIVKLNSRLESVLQEILLMSEQVVETLISECKKKVSTYFMLSEAIALLDLVCSFAENTTKSLKTYVCPEFSNKLMIKEARHPILETMLDHNFIPNDIISMHETSRIQIITGANRSGKSVYLKQISLIIIMAQIGSFVPADYAVLKLFRSIHTRTASDSLEPTASTFSAEMTDMAFILNNANSDSLVIIDELGRGTSYTDGFSICLAIIEKLVVLQATCFMCTHFVDIPKILKNKIGVIELYMSSDVVEDNEGELKMNYKLTNGINWITGYGIQVLRSTKIFPQTILDDAHDIGAKLKLSKSQCSSYKEDTSNLKRNKLVLDFYETIKHIAESSPVGSTINQLKMAEFNFIQSITSVRGGTLDSSEDDDDTDDDDAHGSTSKANDTSTTTGKQDTQTKPKVALIGFEKDEFIDFRLAEN